MRRLLIVALAVLGLVACGTGSSNRDQVLVSAAASLTDAFAVIETEFELDHLDLDIVINHGGSSALREQILAGAPVDVFASANPVTMTQVLDEGFVVGDLVVFAVNSMAIAVPFGNPAGVIGLDDFADDAFLVGLCAQGVPCGDFARSVLANAGVDPAPDTNEPDVRALLTKIEAGELDTGIVYATDIAARADAVSGIDIAAEFNVRAEYPIAVLAEGENREGAEEFVSFVLSTRGQSILAEFGFAKP
ncbi:MAG: molybdate ABC transporter substrate-binding protein [bacterium]|nr:molybdate ABC transporter substrate-binding protein [bacterium]MCP4968619.1 molybdate ABC transporter substrate-binding protein [bacterium]